MWRIARHGPQHAVAAPSRPWRRSPVRTARSPRLLLATWAGLVSKADDVVNLRLALVRAVAELGGLLLAFAIRFQQPGPTLASTAEE